MNEETAARFDDILECIGRMEKALLVIEEANSNGGQPEKIDEVEVERWKEETLKELSAKSRVASPESSPPSKG